MRATPAPIEGPSVAVRALLPFYAAMRDAPAGAPAEIDAFFRSARPERRLALSRAFEMVQKFASELAVEDLGLRAGAYASEADFDLLDYCAITAPTYFHALRIAGRFQGLLNEASELELVEIDGRPILRFMHCMPMPRYACDYFMTAMVTSSLRWSSDEISEEIWFAHDEPRDPGAYRATFGATPVLFGRPFDGIVLTPSRLHESLPGADPKLHGILMRYAAIELERLSVSRPFTRTVRLLIEEGLETGQASASDVADRLNLTRRTLTRRLTREGTGFAILGNQVRLDRARHYLAFSPLSIDEVAERLGYAEPAAFHRAFKRWSGVTPSRYRQLQRILPDPERESDQPDGA